VWQGVPLVIDTVQYKLVVVSEYTIFHSLMFCNCVIVFIVVPVEGRVGLQVEMFERFGRFDITLSGRMFSPTGAQLVSSFLSLLTPQYRAWPASPVIMTSQLFLGTLPPYK